MKNHSWAVNSISTCVAEMISCQSFSSRFIFIVFFVFSIDFKEHYGHVYVTKSCGKKLLIFLKKEDFHVFGVTKVRRNAVYHINNFLDKND